MDYISTFYDIIKVVTDFLNYPIPEYLYIYLEKWYPYFITFFIIFLMICIIKRSRFRYYLYKNHFLLIFVIAFIFWAEFMVVPRLEIMGPSRSDIPTKTTMIICAVILFLLAITLFLLSLRFNGYIRLSNNDYQNRNDIIRGAGKIIILFSFFCFVFFCTLFATSYDGSLTIGHISCDTDSEYKIGHLVSTTVNAGGPDTGLLITLSSEKPGTLKEISSLSLNSSDSMNQINSTLKSNGCLTGKAIDEGKYKIDINTTSLDPGYYNLRLENAKYKQINSVNTFYLSV